MTANMHDQAPRGKRARSVWSRRWHLARVEYNVPLPDIDDTLRLVLRNAGGPPVDPSATLHLDARERDQITIAAVVASHSQHVLTYRPVTTTEQESSHD